MGAEQSNSSVVFDDELVLKVYRRLEAGENPELEMLRFLTDRGFPQHRRRSRAGTSIDGELLDATLGVAQDFVAGARDGWELALDELAPTPARSSTALRALGEVTGAMHAVLGLRRDRPGLRARGARPTRRWRCWPRRRRGDRARLPRPARGRRGARADRRAAARRCATSCAAVARRRRRPADPPPRRLPPRPDPARPDGDWVILDFEGEPARPLARAPPQALAAARRRRDAALVRLRGQRQRARSAARRARGLGARARDAFLDGYLGDRRPALLPAGEAATERLLPIFELEKAVYELRYELDNRPDWVRIPGRGHPRACSDGPP